MGGQSTRGEACWGRTKENGPCRRSGSWQPHMRPCLPLDYEFSENCGLNDFGDHVTHPFRKCPRGQCNPDNAELCRPCGGRARVPTPEGTQRRCREVLVGLWVPDCLDKGVACGRWGGRGLDQRRWVGPPLKRMRWGH